LALKHGDIVQSLSWSANGTMMVTTSRDKKLRVWDVRQERAAHEVQGHTGAKNSRAVWMGEHNRIATTGFSKMSDRQMALWDVGSPAEPIGGFQVLDSISGVCMPFWGEFGINKLGWAGLIECRRWHPVPVLGWQGVSRQAHMFEDVLTILVMVTSDTSSTRTTSSSSCPNTSLVIHSEVSHSFQDVV
jgi:WD40 repeat protein